MKKNVRFIFVKSVWVYAFLIFLILFSALESDQTIIAAKNALTLCAQSVIPSLFPFFVFSSVLISSGFANVVEKGASFFMRPLFNVGGSGAYAFIIGILSGYPMGAHTISTLYKSGAITAVEAERLLPFCNNSGPLFIIGAVGSAFFKNAKIGIFLYLVHIFSAILVGFVMRFYKQNENIKSSAFKKPTKKELCFGKIFSLGVENAVFSILNVCGFVVIFSVISAVAKEVLAPFIQSDILLSFLSGILEITSGVAEISKASLPLTFRLCLISFLLGFSGICISLQVSKCISGENISMKTYFFGKLLHGIFSCLFCKIFLRFFSFSTFSLPQADVSFPISSACLAISFIFLLSFLYISIKKHKLF
ncbi:MAG: sporulation protein [Clostridia bacterium]|nr:sporulation protein [Clostridia bacterium]